MSDDVPHTLKIVTIWLLVGAAVFLGFQWWQHEAAKSRFHVEGGVIEIRRAGDGHYHWAGKLNGRKVEFLVDTGASGMAIPASLARELKLETLGPVMSNTAGGVVRGEIVLVGLELEGGVRAERLRAVALPSLDHPLLGMDVLGRLRWQQRDGVLRIDLRGPAGNTDR